MEVKVGDMVDWDKVPSGALVLVTLMGRHAGHALRVGDSGAWVGVAGWCDFRMAHSWPWSTAPLTADHNVTIIALDVPSDATAEQLRELVEVFEVREVLYVEAETRSYANVRIASHGVDVFVLHGTDIQAAAVRLHAAGWRPGMTAEDAARMFAEVRDGEA